MSNDEILTLARSVRDGGHWNQLDIIRFGALVAAAEREVIIDIVAMHGGSVEIEAAIRARSKA